jgi:porphobilinogen synthase
MNFPIYRPRRLRRNEKLRELVRETSLEPRSLIYPIFVGPGKDSAQPVSSMPGVAQLTVDRAVKECLDAITVWCNRRSGRLKTKSRNCS